MPIARAPASDASPTTAESLRADCTCSWTPSTEMARVTRCVVGGPSWVRCSAVSVPSGEGSVSL